MDDSYLPGQSDDMKREQLLNGVLGAMVLGHSLKDKGAKARLVVLATIDNLSASTITELRVGRTFRQGNYMLTRSRLYTTRSSPSTGSSINTLPTST